MTARRHHALGGMVLVCAINWAAPANAQFSASGTVVSDERFRGLSLSGGRPVVSLDVVDDDASGVYLGASLMVADTAHGGARVSGAIEYLGYALRDGEFSWDIGVKNTNMIEYDPTRRDLNYDEVYLGLSRSDISAHIFYSPDYFTSKLRTIYADFDAVARPVDKWRLSGHVGVLTPLAGPSNFGFRQERYDVSVGVAREFKRCEINLSLSANAPDPRFQASRGRAAVAGLTYFF